jgi:hypothetical protein
MADSWGRRAARLKGRLLAALSPGAPAGSAGLTAGLTAGFRAIGVNARDHRVCGPPGQPDEPMGARGLGNAISTAKYSIWTFLFKFLLEQFMRLVSSLAEASTATI